MKTILNVEEAKKFGRPIGKVSTDKILAFITEVENTIVRKEIGDELYLALTNDLDLTEDYQFLLDGGTYEDTCGNVHILTGLKAAIAYFVYAQNVRAGDYESTRYGMVIKDDEYSTGISAKERDQIANSATAVAESYMSEVKQYCQFKGIRYGNNRGNVHITSGCVIRKIKNV